ncbi:MAG TPA: PQQ-binding-like beta-propeller repeat protein [Gemmataceae bacterium]|nr:PQQ-binding-like beta-propeller repeat protein [Gemmataceae bacterium]
MKPLPSVLALVLTATTAMAQDFPRQFSRPAVPPREVLNRLNLTLGWYTYVPTDGRRDSIFSIQLTGDEMLVQTRSGTVTSLDPETGRLRWGPAAVGLPYRHQEALGYNTRLILVTNGTTLYALDRKTGQQQWSYELPAAPIAPVVADDEQIYASLSNGRLHVFRLVVVQPGTAPGRAPSTIITGQPQNTERPPMVDIHGLPPPAIDLTGPYGGREYVAPAGFPPPAVKPQFFYAAENTVEATPLVSPETLLVADSLGNLLGLSKYNKLELFTLKTGGKITAPLNQHGEIAYAASADRDLYTVNMVTGKILWRFTSTLPIYDRPAVTDTDLYVSPAASGMYRLDRPSGEVLWHSPQAQRFLASNPKFVYATDRSGRLLVLDGRRGTVLSGYDTHDYVLPVSNDLTDRVYLAAQDGLIVCLHDRDYVRPVLTKKSPEQSPPPAPKAKPPAKPAPKPAPKEGEADADKK